MKKIITLSFIAMLFFQSSFAQIQSLFVENFSSTISGTQFTNWTRGRTDGTSVPTSNSTPFTPVNNTPSSGYSGASGGIAMIIANGAVSGTNEYVFSTTGFSSIGYSSLNVNYGFRRTSTFSIDGSSTGTANFPVLEWSTDANTWNIVSGTNALSTVTSAWNLATVAGFDLPSGALNQPTLYFRFRVTTNSSGSGNLRIDDFSVTGIGALSSAASITGFTLAGVAASINGSMITVTVPNGTNLSSVVASGTISANSTVNPSFASVTDFSSAVTFTVTAQNMSTTGIYTVNATVATLLSDANSITGFSILGQAGTTTIAGTTIGVSMPFGTDLTALTPTITFSPLATVYPASGVAQNFSSPFPYLYTVTAQSGAIRTYEVTVFDLPGSGANSITGFTLPGQSGTTTISGNTIMINLPNGTVVTSLTPTISISQFASISPATGIGQDFSFALNYTVTSQIGSTNVYTVVVSVLSPLVTASGDFFFNGGVINLSGSSYGQNFDYTSPTTTLTGWYLGTLAGSSLPVYTASVNTWSNFTAGFKNYASAKSLLSSAGTNVQNAATDRALGTRQTGASGDPGTSFMIKLANTTGYQDFNLSFALQSLDITSPRITVWKVEYGLGETPTFTGISSVPAVLTTGGSTFNSTTVNANFGSVLNNLNIPVWIRLTTNVATTGSSNRATTAIDDFTLSYGVFDPAAYADAKSITGFSIPTQSGILQNTPGQISGNMITVTVPFGSNLSSLSVTGVIPVNATVNPSFSALQNFSNPVIYTVTAQNLSTNVYTVTAIVSTIPSNDNTISGFSFPIQSGTFALVTATVNNIAKTVNANFLAGSNITNLKPTIIVSPFATVNPDFNTLRDFSSMLTYTVTAQSGLSVVYTVTSTVTPPTYNRIATLGEIRNSLNSNGITTIVGIVTVVGQVYGENIHTDARTNPNTTSFQYSILDGTGALSIRTNNFTFPIGTTVGISAGDMITVVGIFEGIPGSTGASGATAYGQFNGWLQLTPIVPIIKGTSGNSPKIPSFVTALGENLESDLVSIVANISTTSGTAWIDGAGGTAGFSVPVTISGTNNVVVLRITPQGSELYGKNYADVFGSITNTRNITITGIVGQFQSGTAQTTPMSIPAGPPYNAGYQITPFKLSDIIYPGKLDPQTLTGFAIPNQDGETTVSGNNISIFMFPGTPITALVPVFTVTGGASVSPSLGATVDFSSLVTYTVTAFGGATRFYTITVTSPYVPSSDYAVLSLTYLPQTSNGLNTTVTGSIAGSNIFVEFPIGVTIPGLVPTFAISPLATGNLPAGLAPNYAEDTTFGYSYRFGYTVTAEDGLAQPYTVRLKAMKDIAIDTTGGDTTSIASLIKSEGFAIYPNPTSGSFKITKASSGIEIYNSVGAKVFETLPSSSEISIEVGTLGKGIYLVREKKSGMTKTLIVE